MGEIMSSFDLANSFAVFLQFVSQNSQPIGFATIISICLLYVLGATGRVVIFFDGLDLAASVGMIIVPIFAMVYVRLGAPDASTVGDANVNLYYSSSKIQYVLYGSYFLAGLCFLYTIVNAFKYNGILLGVVVAFFKIAASLALLAVAFLFIFGGDKNRKVSVLQIVGIAFIASLLLRPIINGERVLARRKLLSSAVSGA